MARNLGADLLAAATSSMLKPVLLVHAAFDTGDVRLWNGLGPLVVGADTYTGAGGLIGISEIEGSTDLKANALDITLNGGNQALADLALTEDCQNRMLHVYLAAIKSDDTLTPTYEFFSGKMSNFALQEAVEDTVITLNTVNELADLAKARLRSYTLEDQKIDFPNDLGLEGIPGLQDATLNWGRPQ